jgi:hypothetical protein
MLCTKCGHDEERVYIEWDEKHDCLTPYFCQECGNEMGPCYDNISFDIKGPSPSKDVKAKRVYNEQMAIYNEGFKDKEEMKAAGELVQEREKERKAKLGAGDVDHTAPKDKNTKETLKKKAEEQRETIKKSLKRKYL